MRLAEPAGTTGGLLLIPVSGGTGSGELQRARLLARSARARWPQLPITIAAESRALNALIDDEFDRINLPASPTRSTPEVVAAIAARQPSLVIFDSTARPAQLHAARAIGAQVIYLSSRPSARSRGFRLGVLGQLSEHWSVEFCADAILPNRWQRWLLRWHSQIRWRSLGTLHEAAAADQLPIGLRQLIEAGTPFALFCPGGGGAHIEGQPVGEVFTAAARSLQATTVVVRGDWPSGKIAQTGDSLVSGPLPNAALMALLQLAQMAVIGAGSLLLQALAQGTPVVATALAGDQAARMKALGIRGALVESASSLRALSAAAQQLWNDESQRQQLRHQISMLGLRNGLNEALDTLGSMLPARFI